MKIENRLAIDRSLSVSIAQETIWLLNAEFFLEKDFEHTAFRQNMERMNVEKSFLHELNIDFVNDYRSFVETIYEFSQLTTSVV